MDSLINGFGESQKDRRHRGEQTQKISLGTKNRSVRFPGIGGNVGCTRHRGMRAIWPAPQPCHVDAVALGRRTPLPPPPPPPLSSGARWRGSTARSKRPPHATRRKRQESKRRGADHSPPQSSASKLGGSRPPALP